MLGPVGFGVEIDHKLGSENMKFPWLPPHAAGPDERTLPAAVAGWMLILVWVFYEIDLPGEAKTPFAKRI